jgi:hypothetical protein
MLHLLAFPEQRSDLLALLAQCLSAGDDVVLLDQGLAWLQHREALQAVSASGATLYFLDTAHSDSGGNIADTVSAIGAGTAAKAAAPNKAAFSQKGDVKVAQIDHLYLIQLSAQHQASSSWYP